MWSNNDVQSHPPVVVPIKLPGGLVRAFGNLANRHGAFLLDSGEELTTESRYSFAGVDPIHTFASNGAFVTLDDRTVIDNPYSALRRMVKITDDIGIIDPYLPFCGGLVGFISYEWGNSITAEKESHIPDVMFGLYDTAVTYDHLERMAWVTSLGLKEDGTTDGNLAKARANGLAEELNSEAKMYERFLPPLHGVHPILSSLTKDGFINGFNLVKGAFNLPLFSQQFRTPTHKHPWDVYLSMRSENPTAFAGYINCGNFHVLSASRTCLIKVGQENVFVRPTKGSRARGATVEDDRKRVNELKFDEEVQTSHRSLVSDVVRDMSKACPAASIEINGVANIETDHRAHHLVTEISAVKRGGATSLDCLLSVMPAFSDGGAAPVVSRLEGARRDVYTGTIGFIGCNGVAEFNSAFRTMIIKDTISSLHAGAEVSKGSDAEEAFVNTKKAAGHILDLVR